MKKNSNIEKIEISIIIPVYCVGEYINRFLKSLSLQTIQNFKAIFVNDRTPDNSIESVLEYKDYFGDRLIVLNNKKNLGLSGARNVGIEYVKRNPTKYLTFLDPDDWIESDYLEDLYINAEQYSLDLCISGVVRFNESTNKTICTEMINMKTGVFEDPSYCHELAYINPCAYSKLYLFEPIKELRFRDIKRSEDTCYLFEALQAYKRIMFTNKAKYHYGVRENSLTGTISEEKYLSMHNEFAKLMSEMDTTEQNGILDKLVAQIFIRSSLGGVCRLCFCNMKRVHMLEKAEYDYLENNIPSWRHNRYLSFFNKGIGGKKEFALRMCSMLYKIHGFFLFVWCYYIITRITGKDIRA